MSGYPTSPELLWLLIRKSNNSLIKRSQPPAIFSAEKGNVKNAHSFSSSGFIHPDGVAVKPAASGKGVTVTSKGVTKNFGKSKSSRRLAHTAADRTELIDAVQARAAKIFRGQGEPKPMRVRAKRGTKAVLNKQ